ncbi:MAG: S41 family peptidase [Vicinamibacterales bacterium]
MTSRTRLWVLAVSTPIIAFVIIGGYLGRALAKDDTYQHLRVFQDVIQLVLNNYVEPVDIEKAMRGAMNGLADSLDADSGYLTSDLVKAYESSAAPAAGDIGVVITRQYYLRVVSVREGTPAAKAGLRTGDFIRGIDNRATRDMTVFEGTRLLRGAPGSKVSLLVIRGNAADPHTIELVRERASTVELNSRMLESGIGYIHIQRFSKQTPTQLKQAIDAQARTGATRYIIDLRGAATGDLDDGIEPARLFVKSGTLTVREAKPETREPVAAQSGDGAVTAPVILLVDQGTSGAAEVFAAALDGNKRADLIGEHTLGRAARQRLVKLPDGSGLLLSNQRYLGPDNTPIHERGLKPDVEVEQPEVDFGTIPPTTDDTLRRAVEQFTSRAAA